MPMKRSWVFILSIVLCLVSLTPGAASYRYGDSVLCLYRSSEGYTEDNNPIRKYMAKSLETLQLKARYYDIDKGVPDFDELRGVRALISWYTGDVARDKKAAMDYMSFLKTASEAQIKILIINTFGAFGYMDGGKPLYFSPDIYNSFLARFGFTIERYDAVSAPHMERGYYNRKMISESRADLISAKKREIRVVLEKKREDVRYHLLLRCPRNRAGKHSCSGDGFSLPILVSPQGGFVQGINVLSGEDLLFNAEVFLDRALYYHTGYQRVGVLLGDGREGDRVEAHVRKTFDYAKVDSDFLHINDPDQLTPGDLSLYDVIVVADEALYRYPSRAMSVYVEKGGRLVVLRQATLDRDYRTLLGIVDSGSSRQFKDGFSLSGNFLINGMTLDSSGVELSAREISLKDGQVMAYPRGGESAKKYPLVWMRGHGEGKILYWNTDFLLSSKAGRGLITQSLHFIRHGFITGVANVGLMALDELPSPAWNSKEEEYLKKTWMESIRQFERFFRFKYTAHRMFGYDQPREGKEADQRRAGEAEFLKVMAKNKWEIGLCGFTTYALSPGDRPWRDSRPWDSRSNLLKGLKDARQEWDKTGNAPAPFSYSPTRGSADPEELAVIAEVFPSIKAVCPRYLPGGGRAGFEFGPADDRRYYLIPRITSGYSLKDGERQAFYDAIHNFGIVSHVLSPCHHRSEGVPKPAEWESIAKGFDKDFDELQANFPWIRWMTVKQAYRELKFYDNLKIRSRNYGKVVVIYTNNNSGKYVYFRIRVDRNRRIKRLSNCRLVNIHRSSGDFLLKTKGRVCKVILR